jgi:spore maturation protein CgeB
MTPSLRIVILGLTVTSSWGNGHATTYRSLIRGLAKRGHRVHFLERNLSWYAENRDEPHPDGAITSIYNSFDELTERFEEVVETADLVIVGSFVPDGIRIGEWVTSIARGQKAFYDIDTPVTLAKLENRDCEYLNPQLIRRYDAYFTFTGGPILRHLESTYGSPMARALYCSVDPQKYFPMTIPKRWDMGYLGTYSADRQPVLDELLLRPAKQAGGHRYAVAGPQYPKSIEWPTNIHRITHLSPPEHVGFYNAQRFTLNVTREAMKEAGFSPSVRLFEAAAAGVPVISDYWYGLDEYFSIGKEILVAKTAEDSLRFLRDLSESVRLSIAEAARRRVLREHTSERRAIDLERYIKEWHDNASAGAARRHRCDREMSGRLAAGLASQREGEGPGASASAEPVRTSSRGGVHESTGACNGNR